MTIQAWDFGCRIEEISGRNLTRKSFEEIGKRFDSLLSYGQVALYSQMLPYMDFVKPKEVRDFMERKGYLVLSADPKPAYHPMFNDMFDPTPPTQRQGNVSVENYNW